MVANKVPGVRAAMCVTTKLPPETSREHNGANMLHPGRQSNPMKRCATLCACGSQRTSPKNGIAAASPKLTLYLEENNMLGTASTSRWKPQRRCWRRRSRGAQEQWNVAIAIVDAGGSLILFQKLDDTQLGSVNIAIGKARTAVNLNAHKGAGGYRRGWPVRFYRTGGNHSASGRLPVMVDGKLIGAVASAV